MKTLKTLQSLSGLGRVLSKIAFVFSVIGVCGCIAGIISLSFAESELIKLGGVTLHGLISEHIGADVKSIIAALSAGIIACAGKYRMPETEPNAFSEEYPNTSAESIRSYSMAQFEYWTKDPFAANFRKMLTLEQYRDPQLAALYRDYIAAGPAKYMAAIFRGYSGSEAEAMQLALDFYGPMFLLYSVYDTAEDKDGVAALLDEHIKRFFASLCGCKEGNAHAADEQGR